MLFIVFMNLERFQ